MEALLMADDLAEVLRVPKSQVYRLTRNGTIPVIKAGRHYRYCLDDVLRALSS
jgi:excisionase family DNA binding protein